MAGHAPEMRPPGERMLDWIEEVSDLRLSVYMLAVALVVAAVLYVAEKGLPV